MPGSEGRCCPGLGETPSPAPGQHPSHPGHRPASRGPPHSLSTLRTLSLWPCALFIEKGLISRSSLGSLEGAERPSPPSLTCCSVRGEEVRDDGKDRAGLEGGVGGGLGPQATGDVALELLHRRAGGEPVGLSDQGPRQGAGSPF